MRDSCTQHWNTQDWSTQDPCTKGSSTQDSSARGTRARRIREPNSRVHLREGVSEGHPPLIAGEV